MASRGGSKMTVGFLLFILIITGGLTSFIWAFFDLSTVRTILTFMFLLSLVFLLISAMTPGTLAYKGVELLSALLHTRIF